MNNVALTANTNEKVNLVKSIANKTRGPYTPEKYGNVIIPMAIIRRFDCILAKKNKEIANVLALASKNKDITPEKLEEIVKLQCGVPFYNAKCVTLEDLVGDSDNLDANFLEFIGAYSPSVQKILKDLKFREEVEFMIKKHILFEVVKAFSEVDFHPDTTSPIAMGYIFEEIIRTYKANAEAGDHYTPREVIKLCVELMMSNNTESLRRAGRVLRVYDGCCGTGGMLTTLKSVLVNDMGVKSDDVKLYGQEINPEAYAICCAEMLMLGENPTNIREGNTLTEDKFSGEKFDLLITNPPFGVEWKTDKPFIEKELTQINNRFVAGTPRVSDGQLLFLQNLIAKAEDDARIAIILNGSPLFSGDAGSGESEIRRYVLENHLLEAIVALPDQMFYNTGIFTYIWIISKKPNAKRNHKVQLIDATSFYVPQTPKSLGNKRKFIDDASIEKIVGAYTAFEASEISKLFDAADFGYTKVVIERPLRVGYFTDENHIVKLLEKDALWEKVPKRSRSSISQGTATYFSKLIYEHFHKFNIDNDQLTEGHFCSYDSLKEELTDFSKYLKEYDIYQQGIPYVLFNAVFEILEDRTPYGAPVEKGNGYEPDPELRDTETIPLKTDIDEYIKEEVLPYVPDAFADRSKDKIGYEIPITRYFYKYTPPRKSADILAEIAENESSVQETLKAVLNA